MVEPVAADGRHPAVRARGAVPLVAARGVLPGDASGPARGGTAGVVPGRAPRGCDRQTAESAVPSATALTLGTV